MSRFDGLFDAAKQHDQDEAGAIGTQTSNNSDVQMSKHPDIPLSKSKDPEYQRTTIYLPRELHRRFKSAAALKGEDMSDVVSGLVSEWLLQEDT